MADRYLTHITREGERWDQLAAIYYGNAYRYEPIVRANPHVPLTSALAAGLTLRIPVLDAEPISEELPPWFK